VYLSSFLCKTTLFANKKKGHTKVLLHAPADVAPGCGAAAALSYKYGTRPFRSPPTLLTTPSIIRYRFQFPDSRFDGWWGGVRGADEGDVTGRVPGREPAGLRSPARHPADLPRRRRHPRPRLPAPPAPPAPRHRRDHREFNSSPLLSPPPARPGGFCSRLACRSATVACACGGDFLLGFIGFCSGCGGAAPCCARFCSPEIDPPAPGCELVL
jgi:hypothetical protein